MLWYVGQFGIALEVLGAAVIVHAALRAQREFAGEPVSMSALRDQVRRQSVTEVKGFIALAVGLAMQFAGGFSLAGG